MKKRIFLLITVIALAAALVFALTACGDDEGGDHFKIIYDYGDGRKVETSVPKTEQNGFTIAPPSRAGYAFVGLYDSADGGMQIVDAAGSLNVRVEKDLDLYARWTPLSYTVKFDAKEGSLIGQQGSASYEYDTQLGVFPTAEREGYDFIGWYLNEAQISDGGAVLLDKKTFNDSNYGMLASGEVTLRAEWARRSLTVTFDYNDGSFITERLTVYYGDTVYLADFPFIDTGEKETRGWAYANNVSTPLTEESFTVTEDVTYYALWRDYKTVELVLGDGVGSTAKIYKDLSNTIEEPRRTGYAFDGWYENSSFSGNPVTSVQYHAARDKYYAKWIAIVYTVTFAGEGYGPRPDDMTYTIEQLLELPEVFKDKYTFLGWCTTEEMIDAPRNKIPKGEHGDLTLYPKFKGDDRTVILNAGEGAVMNSTVTLEYGAINTLPVPAVSGDLAFAGWYLEDGTRMTYEDGTALAPHLYDEEMTFVASYLPKRFVSIILDHPAGAVEVKDYYVAGEAVRLEFVQDSVGYSFGGFYIGSLLVEDGTVYEFVMPEEDVAVTVALSPITMDVTLNANGGSCAETVTLTYGESFVLPKVYKNGHKFIGWYLEDKAITDSSGASISEWREIRSTVLIAKYQEEPKAEYFFITDYDTLTEAIKNSYKNAVLANDIDLDGRVWTPVAFSGAIDGCGYSISNFAISAEASENIGFFSKLTGKISGVVFKDVVLSTTSDKKNVGMIAGNNAGTIDSCTTYGIVSAQYSDYVGGIAGTSSGTISNCINLAGVTGDSRTGGISGYSKSGIKACENKGAVKGGSYTGGIAGEFTGEINVVKNHAAVNGGGDRVGGIVGYSSGKMNDVYNYATVTGAANYVGGIAGYSTGSGSRAKNTADVSGVYYVGGFYGYENGNLSGFTNTVNVTAQAYVGGIVGKAEGSLKNCINRGEVKANGTYDSSGSLHSAIGGIVGHGTANVEGCENYTDISASGIRAGGIAGYLGGNAKDCVNYGDVISTANTVGGIVGNCQGTAHGCKNTGDVQGLVYVGGIVGSISGKSSDGCENTGEIRGTERVGGILGYSVNDVQIGVSYNKGDVFGELYVGSYLGYAKSKATLTGLKNTNVITAKAYVGGIVGYGASASLVNCENEGEVIASGTVSADSVAYSYIGGLGGYVQNITSSKNTSDITGLGARVGGLAGYAAGYISGSVNEGDVVGKEYTGGLGGYVKGSITGSTNTGSVEGTKYTGGSAGYYEGAKLEGVTNTGAVSGTEYVSGLVGYTYNTVEITTSENKADVMGEKYVGGYIGYAKTTATVRGAKNANAISSKTHVGGIIGYGPSASLIGCENTGAVTASGTVSADSVAYSYIGGLGGYVKNITDSKNTANITGLGARVGGLAGHAAGYISGSVNEGGVTGKEYTGGLAGYAMGAITESSNSGAVSGTKYTGGSAGYYEGAKLEGVTNTGAVSGTEYVSGLVGYTYNTVEILASQNLSDVTGDKYVGGYIGYAKNTATVRGAKNANAISSKTHVGGIIGYGAAASLIDCENTGAVTAVGTLTESSVAYSHIGGLAGYVLNITNGKNTSDIIGLGARVGGLAGSAAGYINDSVNEGNVSGKEQTGGLAGYARGAIKNSSNTADVSGTVRVGGLIGYAESSSVSYSSNGGAITGTEAVGGLIGYAYNAIEITFSENSGEVIGATSAASLIGSARTTVNISYTKNLAEVNGAWAKFVNTTATANGVITIFDPEGTDIRVSDDITPELIGITALDSAGTALSITIEMIEGEQTAGSVITVRASATDGRGNTDVRFIDLRVYGAPTVSYTEGQISLSTDPTYPGSVVSFDMNGISLAPPPSQLITDEISLVYPEIPVVEGYVFRGWFAEPECLNVFDFTAALTGDVTLYAGWHRISTQGIANDVIEVYNNYNDTSNLYSAYKDNRGTASNPRYIYFTARSSGEYKIYYRNSSNISTSGNYTSYIQVTNALTGDVILSNTSITTGSNAYVAVNLNEGDVITVRMYAKYTGYNVSCQFFVVGGGFPDDGATDVTYEKPRDILGVSAKDSFGGDAEISVALKSGSFSAGEKVVYIITATDKLGNVTVYETEEILVTA